MYCYFIMINFFKVTKFCPMFSVISYYFSSEGVIELSVFIPTTSSSQVKASDAFMQAECSSMEHLRPDINTLSRDDAPYLKLKYQI
jgi:hypothetical protein